MTYILIGCLAFILFLIFDLNKLNRYYKHLNLSFILGLSLLLFCTIALLVIDDKNWVLPFLKIGAGFIAFLSLLMLIYTLFGAMPFKQTYIETKRNTVIRTGMYALCRHPGVLWFFLFYLFLGLAAGSKLILVAALVWTSLDIIYVYIQDRWIFPGTLEDYDLYQKNVPFLIPDSASVKNCIHYYWERVVL